MAPEAKRQQKKKIKKTKTQGKSFLLLFLSKLEFRTYFVYFHTFSYKFKVQRTPTAFGLPVIKVIVDRPIKGGATGRAGGAIPHQLSTLGQLKIVQAEIYFSVAS